MPVKFLMPKLITQYDKAAETHSEIIAWDVNYGAWFFMRYKPSYDRFYLNGDGDSIFIFNEL